MLARPEIKSAEHILLWLGSKPSRKKYDWPNRFNCACGQYWRENVDAEHPGSWSRLKEPALDLLNSIAYKCKTFGALHRAYDEALHARPRMFREEVKC